MIGLFIAFLIGYGITYLTLAAKNKSWAFDFYSFALCAAIGLIASWLCASFSSKIMAALFIVCGFLSFHIQRFLTKKVN
jgi:hypothetical protein